MGDPPGPIGFVGGPIFPLLFVGGSVGSMINIIAPDVPLALAVTASMAAVPSAVIPVPFSIAALTVLIAGIPLTEVTPIVIAGVVALMAGHAIEAMIQRRRPQPAG